MRYSLIYSILHNTKHFKFGRSIQEEKDNDDPRNANGSKVNDELGCSPYLQVFKAGKLVFTTAASKSFNQSKDDLPFCVPSDGSITFPVETIVQGDILIRCRHLTRKGQRVSMFRAAFHTVSEISTISRKIISEK